MTISQELIDVLMCPESGLPLVQSEPSLLEEINAAIRSGRAGPEQGTATVRPVAPD